MKHFDEIYDIAADHYGLVTTAQARELGISKAELARWCANGRLVRRGWGVYRLVQWIPTSFDPYAEAVSLVGDDSYLYGDAVLSMCGLAFVDPSVITVATTRRVRKQVPEWVRVVNIPEVEAKASSFLEGIPSQSVADAIRCCKDSVMGDRLLDALEDARKQGYITAVEYSSLKQELS